MVDGEGNRMGFIDECVIRWDQERASISLRASIEYGELLPADAQVPHEPSLQDAYRRVEAALAGYLSRLHHGCCRSQSTLVYRL